MTPEDAVKAASAAYDVVEAGYLRLLRVRADQTSLATAANAITKAADAWEAAEDARLAALDERERPRYQECYDITEVLSNLWADIAAAHDGP